MNIKHQKCPPRGTSIRYTNYGLMIKDQNQNNNTCYKPNI